MLAHRNSSTGSWRALLLAALLAAAPAGAAPPKTGRCPPELAPFDELMTSFMEQHGIPGGALAVIKDRRLVVARGYGWSDREAGTAAEPTSLFRIASLSKPITAAAVMQLVEKQQIRLDGKVLDILSVEPHREPGSEADPRLREVTVLQLLQHTAGFDRNLSFDPMFRSVEIAEALGVSPPAEPEHIIRYVCGRSLDFDPGARYAYSNFGYCLLGRVLEEVSGRGYEDYVKESLLAPLGIRRARIGKTLAGGRAPGEVAYYHFENGTGKAVVGDVGSDVPLPYGSWHLEAMDAHGGWIASAVDLARFAAAFDRRSDSKFLAPETIDAMFRRPQGAAGHDGETPRDAYYACGWMVRPKDSDDKRRNTWHTGSLDGTAALMVRRHDGLGWVVLFNTRRSKKARHLGQAIDPLVHRAADRVERWPQVDLFGEFEGG